MKLRKALRPGMKILLSLVLLFLVLRSLDHHRILHNLSHLEAGWLAALLIATWIGQFMCAQRWRLFAVSLRMKGSYWNFLQIYFVGMFFNAGLPSLVGGDVVKAYVLSRKNAKPLHLGLASVLQDRVAGLIPLLVYGSAAIWFYPLTWRAVPLRFVYLLTWLGMLMALGLAWKGEGIYSRFLFNKDQSAFHRLVRLVSDFHQALAIMRLSRGAVLQVIVISFVNSAMVLWIFQQVTVAAGHPVAIIPFSALFPLITLLTMLPFSLGGLGIREWAYVEGFALLGIPAERAIVIALSTSALAIAVNLSGAVFLPTVPSELRQSTMPDANETGGPC